MTHPLSAFLDLVAADGDAAMLAQGNRLLTRRQMLALSGSLAQGLAPLLPASGPGPAKVMLALPNSPEMVALLPAIWSLGGVPMFFSSKATADQRARVIARYSPDVVIDETTLPRLLGQKGEIGPVRPDGAQDASVVFTSGSTGLPKGVVQKGSTLSSGVGRVARTLGYGPQERILVPIPFAHDYGWGQMLSGLVGGHALILPERDILTDIAEAINLHRPTILAGVPSLYSALLFGISGFERADTASLRLLTSTGSPFSPRLYDALCARIPDARILRNYGLTETYRCCCLLPEHGDRPSGSVGRPIEGVTIRIVDRDGVPVPLGEEGEVVHVGAGVFDRYLDDPAATAQARRIVDGQPAVFTGDFGVLDHDGHLKLLGRRDRLVKSMDVRVNLNDVEEALSGFATVSACAVLSRDDPQNGITLVAFCIPKDAATPRDIQREANRALPPNMRPRDVHCLETLPRTSVGKIDYPALKAMLSDLHPPISKT